MDKKCPDCGKFVSEEVKFCPNCGYNFPKQVNNNTNIFANGKIFLILIVIILIVGIAFILGSDNSNNNNQTSVNNEISNAETVDLTITEIKAYDNSDDEDTSYTYYVNALFNDVPNDQKGYQVKTVYLDKNGSEIGQCIESLSNVYYNTDYDISFGYYTSYKKISVDSVKIEIIKDGKIINNFTSKVDQNKIKFDN